MRIPSDVNFADYIKLAGELEAQEFHGVDKWLDSTIDLAVNGTQLRGDTLPWSKTHQLFRFLPGCLTVWGGINGHRKSLLTSQTALHLAKTERVCIASLEMKPEETLLRTARMYAGCNPSEEYLRKFFAWADDRIVLYDQLDTVAGERILGAVNYAATVMGCKHIFLDSLTKCGLGTDDYNAQTNFVDKLQWSAKHYGIHVHLVCHMRKGQDETQKPGKFDIRGASQITDLADNVLVCWKNIKREQAVTKQEQGVTLESRDEEALDRPDQLLTVVKQRHGSFEGAINLWFHKPSLQHVPVDRNRAIPFEEEA